MNQDTIKLLIFGDICPVADTAPAFASGRPQAILSDNILRLIAEADLTVGNLECAVTDAPKPIRKAGPVLYTAPASVHTLAAAGFSALSLANNHIRDCGPAGVDSTIQACAEAGIATFGAGASQAHAKEPFIADIKGRKIAFVSFAEEEFNAASDSGSGAATLDVYYDFDRLALMRATVDYLVVLYHGGIEYHPYPSPLLRKRCRRMAEAGADLVLCQHSHCTGTYERHGASTILYGQGNSLFGYRPGDDSWNTSLLVSVAIGKDGADVSFIPCRTGSDSRLHLADATGAAAISGAFEDRSARNGSDTFIAAEWLAFCRRAENLNMPLLLGWNRYLIFANRILRGLPLRIAYGRRKRNITHNLIRCESHHEVLRTILSQYNFE